MGRRSRHSWTDPWGLRVPEAQPDLRGLGDRGVHLASQELQDRLVKKGQQGISASKDPWDPPGTLAHRGLRAPWVRRDPRAHMDLWAR